MSIDLSLENVFAFMKSSGLRNEDASDFWKAYSKNLPNDLSDFYQSLQRVPELAHLFNGQGQVDGLKGAQTRHWNKLFNPTLSPETIEEARVIGGVHVRIGLPTGWYMAAYGWLLMRLISHAIKRHKFQPGKLEDALKVVVLRVFQDMILSNTAYEGAVLDEKEEEVKREGDLRNLKNLAGSVADVNEVALELAHLSRNTQNVSMNAQTISSAAAELVASVEEISRNSEGAAEDALETDQTVSAGRNAVNQVSAAIGNITEAVEETAASVDELSNASGQIGQILTVIEGIAEQTNLLALNATIEAARAGEAGKGFAVVAAEVKGLANQTSKSTEDIARRIASLREGMNVILTTMGRSKSAVAAGEEAINTAAATMDQIAEQVRNVSGRMNDISGILHQQKDTSAEIARNIDNVAKTAVENEGLLIQMSGKLHESNERFSQTAKSWFVPNSHRALCEMAKIDHVLFRKRVVDTLMGRDVWKSAEVPDNHNCRLGKWYDSLALPEIKSKAAYQDLAAPHGRVHSSAVEALKAFEAGDSDKAMLWLGKLNDASHEVLAGLEALSDVLHGELAVMDRRQFKRQSVERDIKVEIGGEQRAVKLRDLSVGGARLEGLKAEDIGRPVRMAGQDGCCVGTAVWSEGGVGGVKFATVADEEKVAKFILAG